ncbi:hypothetical protein QQF64_033792 [Cirrhinus molitorella]|uniref:CCHC-type domain-containing protein n=1 Tax=Cirrhinus molitorella TaxID=172907 RepID=A0ABR3MUV8_9TELE
MATDMDLAGEKRRQAEDGLDKRQREMDFPEKRRKRIYAKEATVVVDLTEVQNGKAEDIIRALTDKIQVTSILAVRPKMMKEYEITFEKEEDIDKLADGLMIKGKTCEIKKLNNREFVVSFMHLPAYLGDDEVLQKLEGWGVSPISQIKRRFYPGTRIEDGTRFVRVRFPKEVASLPYSTRMETEEGPQYFRVIHSQQVRTCRLCMSPEHMMKDCPDFKCFKCEERGHFARDCNAVRCPDCRLVLNKCECWFGDQQQEEELGSGQMHEGDSEEEQHEDMEREGNASTDIDGEREETGLTQDNDEAGSLMEKAEDLQTELEKPEEQERVSEEGSVDKDSEIISDGSAMGISIKRRRRTKVIPNLEKAKRKVLKQGCEEKHDSGETVKDGEGMG